MNTIPAGYQLLVTTWENDGDCYNTVSFSGMTFDDVVFYVKFLKVMQRIGQKTMNKALPIVKDAMEKDFNERLVRSFIGANELEEEYTYPLEDFIVDFTYETVGTGYESDHLRVVEDWEIYFHEKELVALTKQFEMA